LSEHLPIHFCLSLSFEFRQQNHFQINDTPSPSNPFPRPFVI
jgi:hypothetical protein